MDRRTAFATAGALAAVVLTGGAALGANLGVLDRADPDPVGQLQPNDPELTTVVVEPAVPSGTAQELVPGEAAFPDGDEYDDDAYGEDARGRDDHEDDDDEGDEHEGRDDDD